MAEGTFRVNLGDRGGEIAIGSYEHAERFVSDERAAWGWLLNGSTRDVGNMQAHFAGRLQWLQSVIQEAKVQGHSVTFTEQYFRQTYEQGNQILASGSRLGRQVLDIQASEGNPPAAFAAAWALAHVNLTQATTPEDLKGAILLSMPGMAKPNAIAVELGKERRNLRDRADRLIDQLTRETEDRSEQFRLFRLTGRKLAIRLLKRRVARWQFGYDQKVQEATAANEEYQAARSATQGEFDALRAAFLEAMRLQAPAKYWRDKAYTHQTAEDAARGRLYVFFPLAMIGIAGAFVAVGWALLTSPPETNATALYFVISGGLATLVGVAFWIGRLLTKLYLSEHHLRIDAEEREIMTTTYLALTKDQAADQSDRQIILTALFRNTPDGIVKDDGPGDLSVAGLFAKLGANPR